MSDIILHHFGTSPFAEKIRLALGIKGLAWHSVDIPMVMPKPLLTALTGGYRKTPVMQIGADIYCDTQCIARELEQRHPQPTLFPDSSEGLAIALSHWSDSAFFQPGAGLSMVTNSELPADILQDRREFFNFLDFDSLEEQLPQLFAQFSAHLHLVESMLRDQRKYIMGGQPGWVDILAYFPLWMARGNIGQTPAMVAALPALQAWEARILAIGHGQATAMSADTALSVARETPVAFSPQVADDAWPSVRPGAAVTVTPEDYGAVPVAGHLVQLTHSDIAIRREDPEAGDLIVHFPRLGYRVEAIN